MSTTLDATEGHRQAVAPFPQNYVELATAPQPDQGEPLVPLRRNFGFQLLLAGSSVSMLGSRATTIAYPLLALAISHSPLLAGWACFAASAPSMLSYIPAGAIVDRCNPRLAGLIGETARGLIIAMVVAAFLLSRLTVWQLIAAAVAEEIFAVFSSLAERRLTCSLVEPDNVPSALAGTEARTHVAVMLGRPLGALLFGVSHMLPFAFDSMTFGANAAALTIMRKHYRHDLVERQPKAYLLREMVEGFGWLRKDRFALLALPLTAGTTFVGQALIMFFLVEAHAYRLSSFSTGLVLAASGLGGVLGAWVAPPMFRAFGSYLLNAQLAGWFLTFACLYLWGWQSFPCMAVAMMFMSLTGALGNVALDNYIAQSAGPSLLGRVMSIYSFITFGALAFGPLVGASLLSEHSPQHVVLALLFAVAILWFLRPSQDAEKSCRPAILISPLPLGRYFHTAWHILLLCLLGAVLSLRLLSSALPQRLLNIAPSSELLSTALLPKRHRMDAGTRRVGNRAAPSVPSPPAASLDHLA